jgi:prepilin-type processing-associated H-X9-DG protein
MFCDGITWGPDVNVRPMQGYYGICYWDSSWWGDWKPQNAAQMFNWKYGVMGHKKRTSVNINYVDGHGAAVSPQTCHGTKLRDYEIHLWKRVKNAPYYQQD